MKPTLVLGLIALALAAPLSACQLGEDGATGIGNANSVTCSAERDLMEKAVEYYAALEGRNPPNEAALVPDYLRLESVMMDLDANAAVVAAPASGCP